MFLKLSFKKQNIRSNKKKCNLFLELYQNELQIIIQQIQYQALLANKNSQFLSNIGVKHQIYLINDSFLYTLLIEFLNVYGCELDYAGKTICPDQPEVFEQETTIIFDPHNFAYCQQQSLVIIDPLNPQNNVGRPSYNVAKIKLAFTVAFSKLLTFDSSTQQYPLKFFFNSAQNIQCSLHSVLVNQYKAYADQIMFGTSTRY